MSVIFAKILALLGGSFLDRVLTHIEKRANSETERQRIQAAREKAANAESAGVVRAGMRHKAFWVPWLIAAVPTAAWFGWGMLDSLFNGALPDVAALPPQLKQFADTVWNNIFYSGAGVAATQIAARAMGRR